MFYYSYKIEIQTVMLLTVEKISATESDSSSHFMDSINGHLLKDLNYIW